MRKKQLLYIMFSCIMIATAAVYYFCSEQSSIIKVKFGNEFLLYWDCAKHEIIEDENYFAILKSKNAIRFTASFIADEAVVCDYVCSKNGFLKKGDIAYLLLREYGKLHPDIKCLSLPTLWPQEHAYWLQELDFCKYPGGLFDYVERYRDTLSRNAILCLDDYERALSRTESDTIKVEFGNKFVLYFDLNKRFIEDSNYYAIRNSRENIRSLAYFITDEEIVYDYSCYFNNAPIKKGDIAYEFLFSSARIDIGRCLPKNFFQSYSLKDKYNNYLLNYIKKNRGLAFQQIISCLDNRRYQAEAEAYDTIKVDVEFGNQFVLHWNRVEHEIIKDENYFTILENNDKIRSLAYFITNEEIVSEYVCGKKSAPLKKGDVAFLLLRYIGLWLGDKDNDYDMSLPCGYDNYYLDYLERRREAFLEGVIYVLDSTNYLYSSYWRKLPD